MSRPVLLINFKNYEEVLGDGAFVLAATAEAVCRGLDLDLIVAPPIPRLSAVAASVKVPVYSQSAVDRQEGKSTGAIIPEALKAAGCAGSIINHSESRVPAEMVQNLVPRMRKLGLSSCVCGQDAREVVVMAGFAPDLLAVEPPELIGGGVAVSQARPGLLLETARSARAAGFRGRLLCGAGIVTGNDVRAAMGLGMDGVLVASSVVKSNDWRSKISELAAALL